MKLTYYGHSCFGIETNGNHVLIDPYITENELAKKIDVDSIHCDFLLLTHGHGDHVSDVERIAKRTKPEIICNFEVANWFKNKGLENITDMNPGGKKKFGFGELKFVNAVHSSSMPDGSYGGVACGILLFIESKTIYISGDTALHSDMKLIGDYHTPDIALLCIGNHFTMGYEDAVIASEFIKCDEIVGMHYDTFGPIRIDKNKAIEAFKNKGKNLNLMEIGSSMNI